MTLVVDSAIDTQMITSIFVFRFQEDSGGGEGGRMIVSSVCV